MTTNRNRLFAEYDRVLIRVGAVDENPFQFEGTVLRVLPRNEYLVGYHDWVRGNDRRARVHHDMLEIIDES